MCRKKKNNPEPPRPTAYGARNPAPNAKRLPPIVLMVSPQFKNGFFGSDDDDDLEDFEEDF